MKDPTVRLTPSERDAYLARLSWLVDTRKSQLEDYIAELSEHDEDMDFDSYDDAVEELAGVDSAVVFLRSLIDRAEMIPSDDAKACKCVRISSRVVTMNEAGRQQVYVISGPFEHDSSQGQLVSLHSPIASALLDRCIGEVVTVAGIQDSFTLRILAIEQSPHI